MVAAAFLCATVAVASLIVRELRGPVGVLAAHAGGPRRWPRRCPRRCRRAPSRCRSCRSSTARRSASAQTAAAVAASLGRAAESGRQEVDRGTLGERLTRFYEYAGVRFIVVFEPFERNGEAARRGDLSAVSTQVDSPESGSKTGAADTSNARSRATAPLSG